MANLNFSLSHSFAGSFLSGFNPHPTAPAFSGMGGSPLLSLTYAIIRGFSVRFFMSHTLLTCTVRLARWGLWCFSGFGRVFMPMSGNAVLAKFFLPVGQVLKLSRGAFMASG